MVTLSRRNQTMPRPAVYLRRPLTVEQAVMFCEEKLRAYPSVEVEVLGTTELFLDMAQRILALESRCYGE